MKYELDKLDKFIEANLCIENLFGDCLYDVDLSSNILFIKQEKERIRLALMMEVCCIEDDKTAEKYIRNHQTSLVYLANKVIAYKEEAVPRVCGYLVKDYLSFSDEVQSCLEFLIGFIEKYFSQYFDRDIAITECYQRLIESELCETLIRLDGLLYQGGDRNLYILVGSILKERLSNRQSPITYRKAFYLRELVSLVISVPENLQQELVYFNFNDPMFYQYCSKKISLELLEKDGIHEKLVYMQLCVKELKQMQKRPNSIYRMDCPSIHEWLSEWLCEEIAFQEKTFQAILPMPPASVNGFNTSEKYQLSLSVGQLGLLASLFFEFCMAERPVYKKLATAMAKTFITKKAGKVEDISWDSLLGKFYKHDKATKDIVVELLLRMVKKVRELKG